MYPLEFLSVFIGRSVDGFETLLVNDRSTDFLLYFYVSTGQTTDKSLVISEDDHDVVTGTQK